MKVYIKSATNISDIQAKIAKKQAEIDKKQALIAKREAAIEKKLKILSGGITPEELSGVETFINAMKTTYRSKIPDSLYFDLIGLIRKYHWGYDDPKEKAVYGIDDDAESIYNANRAIEEAQAILDKYKNQLNTIKQKEKQVDEIPEILKDFMNQLIDEWDRFDKNIRDNSKAYYDELKTKMNELVPDIYSKAGTEKLLELYPRYQRWWEDLDRRLVIKFSMRDDFKADYLEKPFKQKFGVSTDYAMNLWNISDDKIHDANIKEGKRVILDLVNRVTKITGPITDWSGLYATSGNGGWTVLNGVVIGEDSKAKVETILASGPIQRLHMRTLVKEIH